MDKYPGGDGRYHYDSVHIKRENIGRSQEKSFSSSYDYPYSRDGYQRGDYPSRSRWDQSSAYDDRQASHHRRDETRDYRSNREDYLSGKLVKPSRDHPRDSSESSKSRHRSDSRKRHHGSNRNSSKHESGACSDSSEPISKKIYYKNREIAKVPPMPQRRDVKKEPGDDGIEILECSDNKTRTRLRRMNKKLGESDKVCEVVTLSCDSPKATPSHPSQSDQMQNSWAGTISVVPGDRLGMKLEEEVMIPEEEVSRNLSETGAFSEPPPSAEPQYYRPETNASYDEFRGIPIQNYEEPERKLFQDNPFVPSVVQMETAPIAEEAEQSYHQRATCSLCNIRLSHKCKYPDSTSSSLSPGALYVCQCSLMFLHTSDCADSVGKVFVPPLKETGLIKQVDRSHTYECHDCTFKFILQGLKFGSHYFESLTKKDGQLRERSKRYLDDLKPLLKAVDAISRQRYPHEPPSVQERHIEIRRCLVSQCNQGCCIIYHDCPPKPNSGELMDEEM